jgi:indolepyruvate ferredoxin oxidoreductase alpha subunit
MTDEDLLSPEGRKAYMIANEAIVRACLESDVKVYATYPGSPTVEILEAFDIAARKTDLKMDLSVNEKVALETAVGASMVGLRSFASMKSVGMNVAADALYVMAYTGVKGGSLILLADDPHAHSSQSEQDGRWYGYTAYLPMFDPSDPQEAYEMVKAAYPLSEKYGSIFLIRTTTRINHQSAIVNTSQMMRSPFKKVKWSENRRNYSAVGELARQGKQRMLQIIESMKKDLADSPFNREEFFDGKKLMHGAPKGKVPLGIVTSGVSYNYVLESLMRLGIKARILKIGIINPVPDERIASFLKGSKNVLVVEELSPYLENFVKAIAHDTGAKAKVFGKGSMHFSEYSEYNVPLVERAISEVSGAAMPFDHMAHLERTKDLASIIPPRPPIFCAGCPHRGTFMALRRALGDIGKVYLSNDIGCYTMLVLDPMKWSDSQLCMGSSLGVAAGVHLAAEEPVVAVIGDSTLFHAGLPGIVNAVHNDHELTLIILDNAVTAMTGQQSHPGTKDAAGGREGKKLDIEAVLRGLGVTDITILNSFEIRKNIKPMKEVLARPGFRVIISRGECALYHFRNYRRAGAKTVPYFVDKEKCKMPYNCIKDFLCPAISIDKDGQSRIAPEICVGCGECAQQCGFGAIRSTATLVGGEDRTYYTPEDYAKVKPLLEKKKEGSQ